jgi:hypothetical protein
VLGATLHKQKYCYNSVFFISNIVSEDKTKCLPYQEFQNKEEFEDIQRGNYQYICKLQHVLFALFLFVYVKKVEHIRGHL